VTVFSPDGTRADGFALEDDGVARAEGDGYVFTAPPQTDDDARRAARRRPPPRPTGPVGTVHDGFTKLR
jgi:hypothetical protein